MRRQGDYTQRGMLLFGELASGELITRCLTPTLDINSTVHMYTINFKLILLATINVAVY